MESLIMYALFALGLILIVKGGDWFVDGAAWVAEVTGMPKFVVGATIVSIATTLPEIFVSATAAVEAHSFLNSGVAELMLEAEEKIGLAIGNSIGSVICNTAMIMAISIIFMPAVIERRKFIPKAALLVISFVTLIIITRNGDLSSKKSITLLLILGTWIFESIKSSRKDSLDDDEYPPVDKKTVIRNIASIIIGAVFVVIGSRLIVNYGGEIARSWGVAESLIGVTMIAVGTSLPELATAIIAVVKKQPAMSVGNVIGANVIDMALVLPLCSFIYGGTLPISQQNIFLDFPMCIFIILVALLPTVIAGRFFRVQGVVLMLSYAAYIALVSTNPEWYYSLFSSLM